MHADKKPGNSVKVDIPTLIHVLFSIPPTPKVVIKEKSITHKTLQAWWITSHPNHNYSFHLSMIYPKLHFQTFPSSFGPVRGNINSYFFKLFKWCVIQL